MKIVTEKKKEMFTISIESYIKKEENLFVYKTSAGDFKVSSSRNLLSFTEKEQDLSETYQGVVLLGSTPEKTKLLTKVNPSKIALKNNLLYIYEGSKENPWIINSLGQIIQQATYSENHIDSLIETYQMGRYALEKEKRKREEAYEENSLARRHVRTSANTKASSIKKF